jgi:hypothetical protein
MRTPTNQETVMHTVFIHIRKSLSPASNIDTRDTDTLHNHAGDENPALIRYFCRKSENAPERGTHDSDF